MERVYGIVGNLGRANPLQAMIDLMENKAKRGSRARERLEMPDTRTLLIGVDTNISESLIDELIDSGMEKLVADTYTKLDGKHKVEIERDEQEREVHIFSDAGRILCPHIVVENLDKIKAFKEENYIFTSLLDKGVIEFIGTEEEEDCCTTWGIRLLLEDIAGSNL
ncbi:DNA-DIRECTED RNA polymerase I SUBUNIT 2 [Salix purpurea]|uniref:DNA-DIRECTED RNA polymerase I SUBUNIT 2 n=1 Tax=Salix purpurea TaxID=77065 RepID=A0A9Q0W9X8_SALPP|nr:DNA-DIRECTED RNA polymerase I SUBUNIT 2 [Salix purpurea]